MNLKNNIASLKLSKITHLQKKPYTKSKEVELKINLLQQKTYFYSKIINKILVKCLLKIYIC